ncbi:MAG TPA: class I SAM-dependent methyltransferase [Gemmatimonadales bacterium]|nr:class I SAM-dependent methyltransferase [Gemmatimonadales bacterium]
MKQPEAWQPSKVIWRPDRNRYEANPAYVSLGSLYAVTLMAGAYERVIRQHASGRLLDCGCGDVPYYGIYRECVTEAVCVDWGESMHGRVHVDQEVDLTQPLPFAEGRFDTVLLADVLEHIPVPAELMREIARVLAPGGKVIVLVPFLYRVHEAPYDFYRYTEFALDRLASQAGLDMLEAEPYGGYPDVLLDLANKGLTGSRPICRAFLAGSRWVSGSRWFGRWRERTKRNFPLGYCVVARKA